MRAYALLLGSLLSVGTAAVAELALESAETDRAGSPVSAVTPSSAAQPIWYGGTLDPVTITVPRSSARAAAHPTGRGVHGVRVSGTERRHRAMPAARIE